MKQKFLLILLLAFVGLGASAQSFTNNWEISAGNAAYPWLSATVGTVNGLAYNPITKKLYVAERGVGVNIINPATGAVQVSPLPSTLDKGGATGLFFTKIAVTATGEIFATSVNTAGKCDIYYWTDETAEPVKISDDIPTSEWAITGGERSGDTFAVSGSGANVVLYVGGLKALNVKVLVKNPTTHKFEINKTIELDGTKQGYAAGGISPESPDTKSNIWVSGFYGTTNYQIRKYDVSNGASIAELADGGLDATTGVPAANSISKKFLAVKHFQIGTKKFLAVTGAYYEYKAPPNTVAPTGEELALHIYDITNAPSVVSFIAGTKLTNTPINSNVVAAADVDFKKTVNVDGSIDLQFFQLIPRNGFASHTITFNADGTLPVSLSSFNASLVNNQSQLNWSTASESNNAGFEIESSTDGISFNKIGFVASKSSNSSSKLSYTFNDKLASTGITYYRLKQLDLDGKFAYSDVKFINNQILIKGITISPNPTTDVIEVNGLNMDGVTFGLFTANGAKLNTKGLVEGNKLSMAGLKAGIYILKVSKNGQLLQTTKVVKN
ncbi:T9SS type A sorting domain-containing protein [Pedobacter arcticus]|uniref:T9SS type A sorting domain-containing protein n=1 Tax=Pedobacter arcticus TaxID=752140 RepID=UPI00030DCCC0|nr:T9SS type A sorting domain-containing protein [Pedobacter arcticus]